MSLEPGMPLPDAHFVEPAVSLMARRAMLQMEEFRSLITELEAVPDTALDDEDRLEMANLKILCGTALVDLAVIAATPDEVIAAANLRDDFKAMLSLSARQSNDIKILLHESKAALHA
jgi:hypothetical protein